MFDGHIIYKYIRFRFFNALIDAGACLPLSQLILIVFVFLTPDDDGFDGCNERPACRIFFCLNNYFLHLCLRPQMIAVEMRGMRKEMEQEFTEKLSKVYDEVRTKKCAFFCGLLQMSEG